MNKEYSVFDIASWFLCKESMTPKKLQKLCYYAQAWSNALLKKDILNDTKFEAWAHGPVSPELFSKYREYKWNMIPKEEEHITLDEQTDDLLESVWITYGEKSANELEALTHTEMPWRMARNRAGASEGERCNELISADDMANYYRSIYVGDQSLAQNLTLNTNVESGNGSFLDRKSMRFKLCIQECLDKKYCFKKMDKGSLKALDLFISETVDKNLTITEVDSLFLRTKGNGSNFEEIKINGSTRQVFHYGKDRNPFRVFGYYNEDGYLVIHKIDPKHKTHKMK